MTADDLCLMSLREVSDLIRQRNCSALEVTDAVLERIERLDPILHTFITVDEEGARQAAKAADSTSSPGAEKGKLRGVPISVKDHFAVRGLPTTLASKLFADYVTDFDAAVVERTRSAGAVVLGKTNMYELGSGWGTTGHFPLALNPWRPEYSPGGSSSGSAAAVAAGLGYASLASDGGGSVRVPSNYCGVVGLKPTHGRVSYYGSIPSLAGSENKHYVASKTISAAGVIARRVEDVAIVLQTVAGWDGRDPGSEEVVVPDYVASLTGDIGGLVVGVLTDYIAHDVSPENAAAFQQALTVLEQAGARLMELETPKMLDRIGWMWTTIAYVEMAALYGEQLHTHEQCIGPEMQDRIKAGLSTAATDYFLATQARQKLRAEWADLLRTCDVIATPTAPAEPPTMTELTARRSDLQNIGELARYTRPYNMTGFPAITLPDGFSSAGLPLGLQLGGRAFDEATILRAAHAYEMRTHWHERFPIGASSSYANRHA